MLWLHSGSAGEDEGADPRAQAGARALCDLVCSPVTRLW